MKRMTTLKDHERRITTLEGRVGEIEACHGDTMYKMHRRLAKLELVLFRHFKIPDVSEEEIDELLDQE